MYLAMKAQSLNHWTAGEFPVCEFKKKKNQNLCGGQMLLLL